jgi:hypothetical protein
MLISIIDENSPFVFFPKERAKWRETGLQIPEVGPAGRLQRSEEKQHGGSAEPGELQLWRSIQLEQIAFQQIKFD